MNALQFELFGSGRAATADSGTAGSRAAALDLEAVDVLFPDLAGLVDDESIDDSIDFINAYYAAYDRRRNPDHYT